MSSTPNTPANGGQIPDWKTRTKQRYGAALMAGMNEESVETLGISFMKAEIADLRNVVDHLDGELDCLRASLAAPAIPTVDRNSVLEEAAAWHDQMAINTGGSAKAWVHNDSAKNIRAIKSAAPASVPQPAVPQGWKMVPTEPTERMICAGIEAYQGKSEDSYRAMIASAPSQEAQPAAQVAAPQGGEENRIMRQALIDMQNPIIAMQREVPEGSVLNPHIAMQMASEPEWYKRHAQEALDKCATPATVKTAEEK